LLTSIGREPSKGLSEDLDSSGSLKEFVVPDSCVDGTAEEDPKTPTLSSPSTSVLYERVARETRALRAERESRSKRRRLVAASGVSKQPVCLRSPLPRHGCRCGEVQIVLDHLRADVVYSLETWSSRLDSMATLLTDACSGRISSGEAGRGEEAAGELGNPLSIASSVVGVDSPSSIALPSSATASQPEEDSGDDIVFRWGNRK
jgi:hypothetical protein